MRKWILRLLVAGLLVGGAFVLRATVFAEKPVAVTVVTVTRGAVEEMVTNSKAGTVKARQRARLSPEIGGRVMEIPRREGARVKAGDLLVKLDDSTLKAQLVLQSREKEEAKVARESSCAEAERADRERKRYRKLADEQIIGADLLDQVQTAYETAEAACRASSARLDSLQASAAVTLTEVHKTELRAPFDGVLAEVSVEVGEYATPSPPGMMMPAAIEIINTGSIYISAPMDEADSARVSPGLAARVTLDPFPGESFAAKVVRVSPYVLDVEQQNRTIEIEVELADPGVAARLLPGTSADVEVILSSRPSVLRIPTSALLEGGRVLAIQNGVLVERKVTAGLHNWNLTEIQAGLTEGDSVVVSLDRPEVKAGAKAVVEKQEGGKA